MANKSQRAVSGRFADVLGGLMFVGLASALLGRGGGAAREIEVMGERFSRSIRVAQGLSPTPTVDEQLTLAVDAYLADPEAEVADLVAEVDRRVPGRARPHRSPLTGRVSRWRLPGDPLRAVRDE